MFNGKRFDNKSVRQKWKNTFNLKRNLIKDLLKTVNSISLVEIQLTQEKSQDLYVKQLFLLSK